LHRIKLFIDTREDDARISHSWVCKLKIIIIIIIIIAIANDFFLFLILIWGVIKDFLLLAFYKNCFSVVSEMSLRVCCVILPVHWLYYVKDPSYRVYYNGQIVYNFINKQEYRT